MKLGRCPSMNLFYKYSLSFFFLCCVQNWFEPLRKKFVNTECLSGMQFTGKNVTDWCVLYGPSVPAGGGCNGRVNDSSIGVFSKMPRFLKIFARRRRRHKNGRCGSLLENRRFPRVSWFFMGLGSFEGCQSKKS